MLRAKLMPILHDTAQVYSAQIIGVLVSFGISIIVARHLGPEGRGAYGWIMALVFLAIQIGQLGTDTLNRRLAATQKQLVPALAGNSLVQAGVLGTLVAMGFYAYGSTQPTGHLYPLALLICLAGVPVSIATSTLSSLAVGMGQSRILATAEILQRLTNVAVVVGFLLSTTLQVWHLSVAFFISFTLSALLSGTRLNTFLGNRWALNPKLFFHQRNFILTAFGAGLAVQFMQRMDILMLNAWRPLAESGHYAIAQTLTDAMLMLPGVVAYMLLSHLAAEPDTRARTRLLLMVLGGALAFMAAAGLVAALLAPTFIPLLFGAEFTEAVPVFNRLLVATLMVTGFTICQSAVAGYRRARHVIIAPAVGVAIKGAIGWYLVPSGMLAAANASILGYGAAFAVALFLALHDTSRRPPAAPATNAS
ncbi:MAG: oligosaccharide flippase family protein [Proteobacteria bacterium]|nr:oligosaccharide flippase family protein [Pseudomonadota bacterium]